MSGDITLYAKWESTSRSVYIPDTGNNISIIAIVTGVILVSIGGYFILNKKDFFKKLKH
jgi:LPXTG-motif cell wall-anchored protein